MKRAPLVFALALLMATCPAAVRSATAAPTGPVTFTVDHAKKTITMRVEIAIYSGCSGNPHGDQDDQARACVGPGSKVGAFLAKKIKTTVNGIWNRGYRYRCYKLILDLNVKLAPDRAGVPPDRIAVRIDPSAVNIRSWVDAARDPNKWRSNEPADRLQTDPTGDTTWTEGAQGHGHGTYGHEVAHVLGLDDAYRDVVDRVTKKKVSVPKDGAPIDMMSTGAGLSQETIDRLIERNRDRLFDTKAQPVDIDDLRCDLTFMAHFKADQVEYAATHTRYTGTCPSAEATTSQEQVLLVDADPVEVRVEEAPEDRTLGYRLVPTFDTLLLESGLSGGDRRPDGTGLFDLPIAVRVDRKNSKPATGDVPPLREIHTTGCTSGGGGPTTPPDCGMREYRAWLAIERQGDNAWPVNSHLPVTLGALGYQTPRFERLYRNCVGPAAMAGPVRRRGPGGHAIPASACAAHAQGRLHRLGGGRHAGERRDRRERHVQRRGTWQAPQRRVRLDADAVSLERQGRSAARLRMIRGLGVLTLAAALMLAACAPAPTPSTPRVASPSARAASEPPPASDPVPVSTVPRKPACDLVPREEAATALGVSIDASDASEPADDGVSWLSECVYWREDELAPLRVTLGIGPAYVARFEQLRTDPAARPRSGFGDEAVLRMSEITGLDGPVGAMFILTGDAVIGLELGIAEALDDGGLVLVGDGPTQERILRGLGATAFRRLTGSGPEPSVGATPSIQPVAAAALTHPCGLLSDNEVAGAMGVVIAEHLEWSEVPSGQDAMCRYLTADGFGPLIIRVAHGPDGLGEFSGFFNHGYPAVPGVGDRALRMESEGVAELPLVTVLVQKGDAVVELALGPVAETTDGTVLARGRSPSRSPWRSSSETCCCRGCSARDRDGACEHSDEPRARIGPDGHVPRRVHERALRRPVRVTKSRR